MLITIQDDFAAYKVRSILSHNSYDINQLKVMVELNDPHFVILAWPSLKTIDSPLRKSRETDSFRLSQRLLRRLPLLMRVERQSLLTKLAYPKVYPLGQRGKTPATQLRAALTAEKNIGSV
ncbi:hypothetical protein C7B62_20480 [Pleurocapsa sp. CCALA 161]|nr:hypothetical protein C7B62_20480 [Pleurocapsa sp. CCALA 161]